MFAAIFTRPAFSFMQVFRVRKAKKPHPKGPLPSWINDPQLSEQLLKDTGLTIEDLGGRPTYDKKLPFFMQQNQW